MRSTRPRRAGRHSSSGHTFVDACARLREHSTDTGSSTVVLVGYDRADGTDGGIDAAPTHWSPAARRAPATTW
ncbi:hypothetical protein [Streptomyces deserti]